MNKKQGNKKIKLFLGAYINHANAQNINCDHIAKYIDKDRFDVHATYISSLPVDKEYYKKNNIKLHKVINHRYIRFWSKVLPMLFGKYDVYYLPKRESMDECVAKLYKGKQGVFTASVENVVEEIENNNPKFRDYFLKLMDHSFAISDCVAQSVKKYWDVDMPVLHLGIDPIEAQIEEKKEIKNVVWVGSLIERKRPLLLLECAKKFPYINFTMIGDGDKQDIVKEEISKHSIKNVTLTGRIPNNEVYELMAKNDLLLMTSRNEGLPKVIQEAALLGLPSIYIGECYDVDFIESGVNGIKVMDIEEMIEKIQFLLDNPQELSNMSQRAIESVQDYLWTNLIKDYEQYFINIYNENKGQSV